MYAHNNYIPPNLHVQYCIVERCLHSRALWDKAYWLMIKPHAHAGTLAVSAAPPNQ